MQKDTTKKTASTKKIYDKFLEISEAGYFTWDILKTLIFVVALAFLVRFYLVQPFYVEGQSMEPNFNNGEYLLIDELSYHFRPPQRGEVIVFKPPVSTYQNYIKRIIALPEEEISFGSNKIYIKNEKYPEKVELEESYLPATTLTQAATQSDYPITKNNYFVMGDNRTQSSDSRVFGEVHRKNITGRVWFYIKTKPWFKVPGLPITIPKIESMGRIKKPSYGIDQLSVFSPDSNSYRNSREIKLLS